MGEIAFDSGDFFFSQTPGRVNARLAVVVFEPLGSYFDSGFGTGPFASKS